MHILKALKKDHDLVLTLLDDLIGLDDDDAETRSDLVNDIRDELIPHSRVEESLFYNTLRSLDADNSEVIHGFKEHAEAEVLLRALQLEDKTGLAWRKTAEKLKEALTHHIKEEEAEIFAIARKVMSNEDAETLGDLFEKLKPEVKEEGILKTSFDMMVNLLPPKLVQSFKKSISSEKTM
jgi:hemerythrin superfamily protein